MAKTTHIGSIPKLAEGTRREAIGRLVDAISASADKKIGIFERWAARARLRRATVAQLDEISTHILAEYDATQGGTMFNATSGVVLKGFDWDKFGDFLLKVLPVILEFIKQLIPLFAPISLVVPFVLALSVASGALAADVFPSGWRVPAPSSLGPGEWIAYDASSSSATWQTSGGMVARWVTRQECHGGVCRLIRERIVERVGPRRHRVKIVLRTSSTAARPALPVADKSHWRYHVGGVELFGESLRRHLIQAHGVRPEHLSGLSDRELDSLHGHAHEGTMPVAWTRPTPPARVLPRPSVLLVGSGL